MTARVDSGDIHESLARQRSSLFDSALVQLLRAYDSDIESLRLKLPTEVSTVSREHGGVGMGTRGVPARLMEASMLLQGDRSPGAKSADMPVDGEPTIWNQDKSTLEECGAVPAEPVDGEATDHICSTNLTKASDDSPHARFIRKSGVIGSFFKEGDAAPERSLAKIPNSGYFEAASSAILLVFCILTALSMQRDGLYLGYELGFPGYHDPAATGWSQAGGALSILMFVCAALFAAEVVFRGIALRGSFFKDMWNFLDVAILSSVAVEVIEVQMSIDIGILNLLRLLRTLRFVRLFRYIRRFQALYFLMQALRNCWRVLVWCCLMLCAIQTLTAFVINQLLAVFYFSGVRQPLEERLEVFMYFGSFARALLTTFEMALGNWPVPARVLFEHVSEWYLIVFVLHKMTVGLCIIAIINAVFMQETMQLAASDDVAMYMKKRRQTKIMQSKLAKLFQAADASQNGRVDRAEFKTILDKKAVRLWLSSMEFDCQDPDIVFGLLDTEGHGEISAEEFLTGMKRLRGAARAMDLLQLVDEVRAMRQILGSPNPDGATHDS